jgi:hypothetical protein
LFFTLGLVHIPLTEFLKARLLYGASKKTTPNALQKLMTMTLLSLGLSDAVAIYGLLLFLIHGQPLDFYVLFGVSIIMFIRHHPRFMDWEDYIMREPTDAFAP